jgi:hypothetical protein
VGTQEEVSFDKNGITKIILNHICQAWFMGWMEIGLVFCQKQKQLFCFPSQLLQIEGVA